METIVSSDDNYLEWLSPYLPSRGEKIFDSIITVMACAYFHPEATGWNWIIACVFVCSAGIVLKFILEQLWFGATDQLYHPRVYVYGVNLLMFFLASVVFIKEFSHSAGFQLSAVIFATLGADVLYSKVEFACRWYIHDKLSNC